MCLSLVAIHFSGPIVWHNAPALSLEAREGGREGGRREGRFRVLIIFVLLTMVTTGRQQSAQNKLLKRTQFMKHTYIHTHTYVRINSKSHTYTYTCTHT